MNEPARPLNVWIVNPYGWLPGERWRDYRSLPLATALAARGHQVRWWLSDIEHRSKTRRARDAAGTGLPTGVAVELVESRSYRRNISPGRILHERSYAAAFARRSRKLPAPDVIVLADPALFFGAPVMAYARERGIPVVLDVIDLWPEMFHVVLPRRLRGLGGALFAPFYRRRDRLVAESAAVVAVTADYLERATRRIRPPRTEVIYLGRERSAFRPPEFDRAPGAPLHAVYAGNLGAAYDMPVLLAAVERLAGAGAAVQFTLAGDGPWRDRIAALAARFPAHVRYVGTLPPDALLDVYAAADVGLATYAAGSTVSMPTKLFDYLAAGLATVGSMGGEAAGLLRAGAGRAYRAGSADDLVSAIGHYIDHRDELEQARRTAFDLSRRFDLDEQFARYVALIEALPRG